MSHDHDHDHEPSAESPGRDARAAARRSARRRGHRHPRGASQADRLARVARSGGRRAACRPRLGRSGVQSATARGCPRGRARGRPRPGAVPDGRRAREHRGRAPHGRLHALLVLSESSARPAAGLVQEPALPLACRLRPTRRPPRVRCRAVQTTSRCASSTRPPTSATSSSRAAQPEPRAWTRTSWSR